MDHCNVTCISKIIQVPRIWVISLGGRVKRQKSKWTSTCETLSFTTGILSLAHCSGNFGISVMTFWQLRCLPTDTYPDVHASPGGSKTKKAHTLPTAVSDNDSAPLFVVGSVEAPLYDGLRQASATIQWNPWTINGLVQIVYINTVYVYYIYV